MCKLDHTLLERVPEAMFDCNAHGKLINDAPDLYLLRTQNDLIFRMHADLAVDVQQTIAELVRRPRGRPGSWAQDYADYVAAVSTSEPLATMRAGPLYSFSAEFAPRSVVRIEPDNADLLRGGLDEWLPDVEAGRLMLAAVDEGRAVSICASVRASAYLHCAGVETIPTRRGHGFACQAVGAWANVVRAEGATPVYGTTFDNIASQRVASRLGLAIVASEFWVARRRPSN